MRKPKLFEDIEEFIRKEYSPRRFPEVGDDVDWTPLVNYLDNQLF